MATIALEPMAAARVIHQDLPHEMRGHGKEVRSVLKLQRASFG
jgi:hypothetical protein